MKVIAFLLFAGIIGSIFLYYISNFHYETVECERGDRLCIENFETNRENCIPSSTIIHGRDGIVLMVNITREDGKCVRKETVIGSENPESDYLLGRNMTCEYGLSGLQTPSETKCPGSLYDYVVEGKGSALGGGSIIPTNPRKECGLEDEECKYKGIGYIESCIDAEIITTDLRWEPLGYWTMLTKVNRRDNICILYFEILNAVNLPPGIPTTIIGSNMTCKIPVSEFPIQNLTASWCAGELYNYI